MIEQRPEGSSRSDTLWVAYHDEPGADADILIAVPMPDPANRRVPVAQSGDEAEVYTVAVTVTGVEILSNVYVLVIDCD